MAAEIPVLEPAQQSAPTKAKRKLWLILVAGLLLLLLGLGAAAVWLQAGSQKGESAKVTHAAPPLYLALDPPFVVNFESEGLVRFLQVTVQLMSRDAATIELLKANDPVVRNDLLLLFANQKYAVLATREGKEALRAAALSTARQVLTAAGGHGERLEAVYFTTFVMQ